MSLTNRLEDIRPIDPAEYVPFWVNGVQVGMMKPAFAACLAEFPEVFDVSNNTVKVSDHLSNHHARSHAVARVLEILREQGLVPGWRGELYPVHHGGTAFEGESFFDMERAASTLFGIRTYGVNLHGYLRQDDQLSLWIARRSQSKETSPGKLDIVVGGGQPSNISLKDNLIKECQEEAGIPGDLAKQAVFASETKFCTERPEGIRNDIHYNYDLELPVNFTPKNTDGEVEDFYLWTVDKVMTILCDTDDFAFDSALAILDFLIRHGTIGTDHPDYQSLMNNFSGKDAHG